MICLSCLVLDFSFPADDGEKWKNREKQVEFLDFTKGQKKTMKYDADRWLKRAWWN